ncbi:MAG: carbohydrate kinase family protein [Phycisphaeraceae bacterium]
MAERHEIARQAAAALRGFAAEASATPVLVGFDGFVDSIIDVVSKRHDPSRYDAVPTMADFGERISAAAGQSSNFEMVTKQQKLGGNGPIMAHALAAAGVNVSYIGAVGYPKMHPVFEELHQHAEVWAVAEPGYTDALEFADGKLLLGKYEHLSKLDRARVEKAVGAEAFDRMVARSRLIGMVNWTMLPGLESIWDALIEEALPAAGAEIEGKRRMIFVDLADPAKRTDSDLKRALEYCQRMNRLTDVILGLNLKEAGQVAAVLGSPVTGDAAAQIEQTATRIREAIDLHCVVVHPRHGAAAALVEDGKVASASFEGPFVRQPRLSTGAGDNFNAGFCLGRLAGLDVEASLCVGTATSGYYVRNAASPSLDALASFCDALPEPETAGV